ncbi:hypothetical protein Cgig2_017683 [Carnegiea gigantea]|uniref:Uncharacterized protein n=1 Tax=Carnegiea gigantea TaxID=171969 RepID=A0A9Q1GKS0_9CARY|nr:hypothetical protein Cgig2_017683 [Carnegiea gigantea]
MGKGRAPCCDTSKVKKGPWSPEEDLKLISHIQKFGYPNWRALPPRAGLLRCGKSCRLRWINYLRPDVKRGNITLEEEEMIINLHKEYGNKWSKIASHLPGRTDNEIKNVWNTYLKKRLNAEDSNIKASHQSKSRKTSTSMSPESSITSTVSNGKQCEELCQDSSEHNVGHSTSADDRLQDLPDQSISNVSHTVLSIDLVDTLRLEEKDFVENYDKSFQAAPNDVDMDIWCMLEGMGSKFLCEDNKNLQLNSSPNLSTGKEVVESCALRPSEMEPVGMEACTTMACLLDSM